MAKFSDMVNNGVVIKKKVSVLPFNHLAYVTIVLIFLYPVLYQSLHSLEHALSDLYSVSSSNDRVCAHSCSHQQENFDIDYDAKLISYPDKYCPVCEYEFASYQKSANGYDLSVNFSYNEFTTTYDGNHLISYKGSHKNLRAPPMV